MDNIGHQRVPRLVKGHKKGPRKSNNSLKVVYISSPMKVKTSATRFRSLVQQLTGKNSDIAHYMMDGNNTNFHEIDCDDDIGVPLAKEAVSDDQVLSSISWEDTPTTSDSILGPMDDVFASQMDEQFASIFSSDSFCDASQMDVLGSYDELL